MKVTYGKASHLQALAFDENEAEKKMRKIL